MIYVVTRHHCSDISFSLEQIKISQELTRQWQKVGKSLNIFPSQRSRLQNVLNFRAAVLFLVTVELGIVPRSYSKTVSPGGGQHIGC